MSSKITKQFTPIVDESCTQANSQKPYQLLFKLYLVDTAPPFKVYESIKSYSKYELDQSISFIEHNKNLIHLIIDLGFVEISQFPRPMHLEANYLAQSLYSKAIKP